MAKPIAYDAIIPAAGTSTRFGRDKLLAVTDQGAVLDRVVRLFANDPSCQRVIVPVAIGRTSFFAARFSSTSKVLVVSGGMSRSETVSLGLVHVRSDHVLVHDAARPYASPELVSKVAEGLRDFDAVIPGLRVHDSVALTARDSVQYVDRAAVRLVQTPQGFATAVLVQAFRRAGDTARTFTDEGSLITSFAPDAKIAFVEGERANVKITFPADLRNPAGGSIRSL